MRGARRYPSAALAFSPRAAVTVVWCGSMAGMPGMEMPGGWTMSMAWMRMPGEGWLDAAGTFIGMWSVMMVAMMLPALTPMLGRRPLRTASGYFAVWILLGVLIFPPGVALAELAMRSESAARVAPLVAAATVLFAGLLQLSPWKARQLACCREAADRCCRRVADTAGWREGMRLGLRCIACCTPLTLLLLVLGVMDLAAMGAVTVAVSLERLAPAGARIARSIGALVVVAGLLMLARSALAVVAA
jgi:predicted metal-binding membrane protein